MSAGAALEDIHKGIARCLGIIGTMIIKKQISRILLAQVRDTLKIVADQIDGILTGDT